MLNFINENLAKIKNPDDVNCMFTSKNENGLFLVAFLADGSLIPLTEPEHAKRYPNDPISWLVQTFGYAYLENFSLFNDHCTKEYCINKKNIMNFTYNINEDKKHIDVKANFKNGSSKILFSVSKGYFKNQNRRIYEKLEDECEIL